MPENNYQNNSFASPQKWLRRSSYLVNFFLCVEIHWEQEKEKLSHAVPYAISFSTLESTLRLKATYAQCWTKTLRMQRTRLIVHRAEVFPKTKRWYLGSYEFFPWMWLDETFSGQRVSQGSVAPRHVCRDEAICCRIFWPPLTTTPSNPPTCLKTTIDRFSVRECAQTRV